MDHSKHLRHSAMATVDSPNQEHIYHGNQHTVNVMCIQLRLLACIGVITSCAYFAYILNDVLWPRLRDGEDDKVRTAMSLLCAGTIVTGMDFIYILLSTRSRSQYEAGSRNGTLVVLNLVIRTLQAAVLFPLAIATVVFSWDWWHRLRDETDRDLMQNMQALAVMLLIILSSLGIILVGNALSIVWNGMEGLGPRLERLRAERSIDQAVFSGPSV